MKNFLACVCRHGDLSAVDYCRLFSLLSLCFTGEPGKYDAKIPLLLNGQLSCPYRYLSIEAILRGPSLVFSQPSVVSGAVPLNVETTHEITLTPFDYPRYENNTHSI